MKFASSLVWISIVLLSLSIVAPAMAAKPDNDPVVTATRLLDHLDAGEYADAEALFDAPMAAAVPADKLKAVWESLPAQAGAATGRGDAAASSQDGISIVVVPLHYANAELVARIAIAGDGKITGFLIQPAPPPAAAAPSANAGYGEREFSVGSGERALPGTMAMPTATAPAASKATPAVVLVHGSGPQDRDETIGPNRPFLDIARGLAAQGIAVLRYEKRTKARPQDFASGDYSVDDETTNDAVAAVAAMRATPGIDPQRIYVMGHSQGAMLAPRIAARSGHVAGLILFATPARPILTILSEQNHHLLGLDGSISPDEQTFLDTLDSQIAAIRSDAVIKPQNTPFGLPAHYWRTFDAIDPIHEALALKQPMLLLQGGRDFQVVDADWQLWHKALDGNPRATFKHYAALNHLGIAGSGPESPAEYQTPGHVEPRLIADVAQWINMH